MAGLLASVLEQCAVYSAGDMAAFSKSRLLSGVIGSGIVVMVTGAMTAELVGMAMDVMRDVMGWNRVTGTQPLIPVVFSYAEKNGGV